VLWLLYKIFSFERLSQPFTKNRQPFERLNHIRSQKIFIRSIVVHVIRPWMAYTFTNRFAYPLRLSVCPLSNGHKQINPTVRINSLNIRSFSLQVEKENIKHICNHNSHSAVGKNRKGYQFKRKLSFHSTIWPSSPLYHFVNRNGLVLIQ